MKSDNVDFEDAATQYQALVTKITTALRNHKNTVTTGKDDDALARSIIAHVTSWIYQSERR